MNNWVNELIDKYYDFLKGRTSVITETGSNWAVISTPFIGLFNDTLEVYAKKDNGKILMSDDGVTIKNLDLIGSPISRSPKRKDLLERILLTYGIQLQDDELIVEATENNFAQKKHNLISAISEINDMYMMAKHTVASVFKEDVQGYLDEQQIIYTPQFISKGSTGLEFTFDFQIAYREKEIVLKSFNTLNKLNLPNFLFTWEDIKSVRERVTNKQVIGLAVINDEEKEIQEEYLDALRSKNADFILWSQRHTPENIGKLKIAA
ncbi:MAG: DUF1828 domain-containing protein [Hydrotalea sp. AMD]|uniref:DUF1828 domain-containing protein n=1 Tax=Hydrotalea sp. AMD TaxID=2501297 RepID=UPI0009437B99|nr:DUF1828 domain-containing protein [Hydrotalea sp. AMD]RWZ85879.1 MAG: DUF1828 domain-containing protein [Hydrotalea sp. AMD]